MIDQEALYVKASRLQTLLNDLSSSLEAARALRAVLSPLLASAINRQVTVPWERNIPGGYMVWVNGSFHEFPEVEEAFAQFQIEISDGRKA